MMTFQRERVVKARKGYWCEWNCAEPIVIGESHTYVVGNAAGDFSAGRFHTECWDAFVDSWHDADAMPGDPLCDERHRRGKTCNETPCGNAPNPVEVPA